MNAGFDTDKVERSMVLLERQWIAELLRLVLLAGFALVASDGWADEYHVGPGQPLEEIDEVPWESLAPGDRVSIHHRAAPYRSKWVIGRSGTLAEPIVVAGVPGPGGELPVIDGADASTRQELDYWNEQRGVIKVGGASTPSSTTPEHVVIENLHIRSARPMFEFTDDSGASQAYASNAAAIYVESARNLVVRNCALENSGNGLFIGSGSGSVSREILIEFCHIHSNGIEGSIFEHNAYTEALGITYQFNRFGPLRNGALGNNLKDRSAGLVVRYNWIESGNRQLDLVDSGVPEILGDPEYGASFVYGNTLIEPDAAGNRQIVHYGGDSASVGNYRNGTLYFYNNTVASTRIGYTTAFRLSSNDVTCDARNNVWYVTEPGWRLVLLDDSGTLVVRNNFAKPDWTTTVGSLSGTIEDDASWVEAVDPGFVDFAEPDFRPDLDSVLIDAGTTLSPAVIPLHELTLQYIQHRASAPRRSSDDLTVGAYGAAATPFVRGDCNADTATDIADAISILEALFGGAVAVPCGKACDANADGQLDIADTVALLSVLFGDSGTIPAPSRECGVDSGLSTVSCEVFDPCSPD